MRLDFKRYFGVIAITLSIVAIGLFSGCIIETDPPGSPNLKEGTVTIRVIGADIHDGKQFYCGVAEVGADMFDTNNLLGQGAGEVFSGGIVNSLIYENNSNTPAVFPGGEYQIGGMIEVADEGPTSGVDEIIDGPYTIIVDGDGIYEFYYPDEFITLP